MYAFDNDDYLPRRGQGVQMLLEIDRPAHWFNALPVHSNDDQQQRNSGWQTLETVAADTNGVIDFYDTVGKNQRRFYRLADEYLLIRTSPGYRHSPPLISYPLDYAIGIARRDTPFGR